MNIPVIRDCYDEGVDLFTYDSFELMPGVTSLIGCNGAGKSTLLRQISQYAREHRITVLDYNDRVDGGSSLMQTMLERGTVGDLANMAMSSEGEKISIGVGKMFGRIGREIHKGECKELIVLLDATDSGMSVDNISEVRDCLIDTVLPDAMKSEIQLYIVVASNNFEWAASQPNLHCFDVVTGTYVDGLTYDSWCKLIYTSREAKDLRYSKA